MTLGMTLDAKDFPSSCQKSLEIVDFKTTAIDDSAIFPCRMSFEFRALRNKALAGLNPPVTPSKVSCAARMALS